MFDSAKNSVGFTNMKSYIIADHPVLHIPISF